MLRSSERPQVQDLRNHPVEVVEELRQLLAADTPARPDPQRADFFEIDGSSSVFFVYIQPGNRKVILLATWPREEQVGSNRPRGDAEGELSLETESLPC